MRGRVFPGITAVVVAMTFCCPSADAIGKKEFFERLQAGWNNIFTFQADVRQESYYRDGLVQIYAGRLALAADGRIAYDYQLTGEFEDSSLAGQNPQDENAEKTKESHTAVTDHTSPSQGSYRAKGNTVNHYLHDQNLLVESSEEETLLIQIFRSLLGTGSFDLEKFKDENKIDRPTEEKMDDGTLAYLLIARPKKGSGVFKWMRASNNKAVSWRHELWVERETMRPLMAVLISEHESTSVRLTNVRVNEPVDEALFRIPRTHGQLPKKIRPGGRNQLKELDSPGQIQIENDLKEIPLEE